jgi:phosphatidylglycerophosphate synthase
VIVYFEYRAWWLFVVGGVVFVLGSVLDILDGALARAGGKGTPFGAFLDSTIDRVGEAFMLVAIALTFMRDGKEWAVALTFVAVIGSFLVSYTRARAEILGLKGDVGIGSRAGRPHRHRPRLGRSAAPGRSRSWRSPPPPPPCSGPLRPPQMPRR